MLKRVLVISLVATLSVGCAGLNPLTDKGLKLQELPSNAFFIVDGHSVPGGVCERLVDAESPSCESDFNVVNQVRNKGAELSATHWAREKKGSCVTRIEALLCPREVELSDVELAKACNGGNHVACIHAAQKNRDQVSPEKRKQIYGLACKQGVAKGCEFEANIIQQSNHAAFVAKCNAGDGKSCQKLSDDAYIEKDLDNAISFAIKACSAGIESSCNARNAYVAERTQREQMAQSRAESDRLKAEQERADDSAMWAGLAKSSQQFGAAMAGANSNSPAPASVQPSNYPAPQQPIFETPKKTTCKTKSKPNYGYGGGREYTTECE